MNKDSKQKFIEELETKNAEIHLDIVPVCCFFLILVIFGMCMLKDIAKETEKKPSVRSQIEALFEDDKLDLREQDKQAITTDKARIYEKDGGN